jgi:acylphosphatase
VSEAKTEIVRAHVWISGRVQGVFFRAETVARARQRSVSGLARNLSDGRVEAVFEGAKDAVDSLIRWCHEGPRLAEVEQVSVVWEHPTGEQGFSAGW